MFFPIRFKTHIQLSPSELSGDFDRIIKTKMCDNLEGVCSRFGYIKPGSLEIVRRSAGMFGKQHFNGYIRFDIHCKGDVCNPPQGMVVEATVKNKNALGLLAESSMVMDDGTTIPVLDIIVPKKSNGISSEIDLEDVQIGDHIFIMVMGKRYQLNDTNISIIGRAVKQPTSAKSKTRRKNSVRDDAPGANAVNDGEDVNAGDNGLDAEAGEDVVDAAVELDDAEEGEDGEDGEDGDENENEEEYDDADDKADKGGDGQDDEGEEEEEFEEEEEGASSHGGSDDDGDY